MRGVAPVVDAGVALVDGHGVGAVLLAHAGEAVSDQVKGVVPRDLDPAGVRALADAFDRAAQAVGVFVDVFEGHGLGQMWPREKGSASLPLMDKTRSPCT